MVKKHAIWLLIAVFSIAGCRMIAPLIAKPTVSFEKMTLQDMTLFDATLLFTLAVHNPNPVGIVIQKANYSLTIEDAQMASGTMDKHLSVQAGGFSAIDLPVNIHFMDFFKSASALALRDEVAYDLSGTFDVMGFTLPYSARGRFKLPEFPEISVKSLNVSDLSLSGARINVVLSVANPNDFAVGLDGFQYALETGGHKLVDGSVQSLPKIDSNEQVDITVPVDIRFLAAGRAARHLLESSAAPYTLTGDMVFNVPGAGKTTVPFSRTGNVSLNR